MKTLIRFLLLAAWPAALLADVTPSAFFQDHAVLQRGKSVPVWGTASPGEKVTVSFAGQTHHTTAEANGRWRVTLAPMPANATPAPMAIRGTNLVMVADVVVGEVWLASGQSNMELRVESAYDSDLERRTARFPLVRELKVKRTRADARMDRRYGAAEAAAFVRQLDFSRGGATFDAAFSRKNRE